MDAQNNIDFITKLPELMRQITDMQVVLDAMEEMDANALSEWQATKAYAELTGHKTVCVARELLPLLHNALHLMHSGKPKRATASAIKEHVFLISSALSRRSLPGPAPAVPLPPVTPADLLLISDCISQSPGSQNKKYRK